MTRGSAPAGGRRPGLDGLRGLAVAAVVAYHLGYLSGGFGGVDVFFVLSGFLITSLILKEAGSSGSLGLKNFWIRRIRRLMPALIVMVVGVVSAALALGWPADERRDLAIDATATLTWWANWRLARGLSYWDSGESLFRHAWSLSIEEQFYILWPLVVVAVLAVARRRSWPLAPAVGVTAAVLAGLSAGWMTVLSRGLDDVDLSAAYVGTGARVMAPLIGCALGAAVALYPKLVERRTPVGVVGGLVGFAMLIVFVVRVDVTNPALYRQGGFLLLALAAALVVRSAATATVHDRDPVGWLTTRHLTRYLGTRSYAIYLWSWPIQVLVLFRWPEIARSPLAVITVVSSLVLAELGYRVIETPLRYRNGWAASIRTRRPAWALGVVSSVVVVALALSTSVPPPEHERIDTAESAAAALESGSVAGGVGDRVLIIGDSVAWTAGRYAPVPPDLPDGVASIESRAIIGCGLLSFEGWAYRQGDANGVFSPPNEACLDLLEAERIGLAGGPDVVLTMPGAWEWSEMQRQDGSTIPPQSEELAGLLSERLVDQMGAAHAVGARYVLVLWACPGAETAGVRKEAGYIRWINEVLVDAAEEGRTQHGADVTVLEPTEEICVDADPVGEPTDARVEATEDEVHIASEEGGRWLWEQWLAPAIRRS